MTRKPQLRDPEAACVRKSAAARRVGVNAKCTCGESRPEALIPKSKPTTCHRCKREQEGKTTMDKHHPFGKSNSPVTIEVPVNDHRADLNVAQYDWPKQTRENSDGSPLIAAAGCVRGFIDTVVHLIEKGLHWIADMLEIADAYLRKRLGEKYWLDTPLEVFASKQ